MLAQWKSTCFTSRRLVVRFHRALTWSIWNELLTITNELWWHFSTVNKIWNGDEQLTPPYICINSDEPQRYITNNHCCWYEMVTVVVRHYSHYSWWTLNVTTTPILLIMWLLVMVNECHHLYVTIVTTMNDLSK